MRMVFIFLALSFVAAGQVPLDESAKEGNLEIRVVNSSGEPAFLAPVTFSAKLLIDGQTKPVVSPVVRISATTTLKYGTYRITVRDPAMYPVDREIKIDSPYQVLVVALFLAPIEYGMFDNYVKGKLPPKSVTGGCTTVRMFSPFSESEHADAKALDTGEFAFYNIKAGKYLLVTLGPTGICEILQTVVRNARVQDLSFQ